MANINGKIKSAVMDILKSRIDQSNNGMLSNRTCSMESTRVMRDNGITIKGNMVYMEEVPIYRIIRKYAQRKVNGMYKELIPKLEEIVQ